MEGVAVGALAFAIVGTLAMIFAAVSYNSVYNTDCTDIEYLNEEYGENVNDKEEMCEDEIAAKLGLSIFLNDMGYPLLLFGLVLMIGANRLQDT